MRNIRALMQKRLNVAMIKNYELRKQIDEELSDNEIELDDTRKHLEIGINPE